jgi:hypothetical protein
MRGKDGKWLKGQSANPGGRPRIVSDVQNLAREQTAAAIETLTSIMQNAKSHPQARVAACRELLDRGYGKPLQQSEVTNIEPGSRPASDMSDDELAALIDRFHREAESEAQQPNPRTLLTAN